MITIRKLRSLPEDTRMRKVIRLLESNRQQTPLERSYLIELCLLVTESNEKRVGDFTRRCSENLISCLKEDREYEFALDDLRYSLASDFNMTSGDWDFVDDTAKLDPSGGPSVRFRYFWTESVLLSMSDQYSEQATVSV